VKVLLVNDVKTGSTVLGWLGDVVDVNEGYGRNYLIPQGLAVAATEANIKSLATEKTKRAGQRKHDRERLEQTAAAVDGAEAVIAGKVNPAGALFGSVTAGAIAANLRQQGFEVSDENVQLDKNIKQVGTYQLTVKFADDLTANITVVVVPEPENLSEGNESTVPRITTKDKKESL